MKAAVSNTISIGGISFAQSFNEEAEAIEVREVTLAVASAGTLSVRTDDNTGTFNGAGHGISTGEIVDIYWDGGARRGMTVGTVAGNDVPIDGGLGDNLPVATTALTIMVQNEEALDFVGNNLKAVAVKCPAKATVIFTGSDDAEDWAIVLEAATGGSSGWWNLSGFTNPVAGDTIAKFFCTHGSSSAAQKITVAVLFD